VGLQASLTWSEPWRRNTGYGSIELKVSAQLPKEQTFPIPPRSRAFLYSHHPPEIKHFLSRSSDKVSALYEQLDVMPFSLSCFLAGSARPLKAWQPGEVG